LIRWLQFDHRLAGSVSRLGGARVVNLDRRFATQQLYCTFSSQISGPLYGIRVWIDIDTASAFDSLNACYACSPTFTILYHV
jgi:hypothetical protein